MHLVFTLCLLGVLAWSTSAVVSIEVERDGNKVKSYLMFGLFGTQYANLETKTKGQVKGRLYYHNSTIRGTISNKCGPVSPPIFNGTFTKEAILLVPDFSECILEKIIYAELVGYSAVLSYTEGDRNLTIPSAVVNTRFPVALVEEKVAHDLIRKYLYKPENYNMNLHTFVTVSGNIVDGIIIVAFCFVLAIVCCLCCCFWCCVCCKVRVDNRRIRRDLANMEYARRNDATRQELLESIMRHLQTMERELGAQIPLGPAQINSIPKRPFVKGDSYNETCAICVDEFEAGEDVRVLPNCGHIFHPDCIDEWLSKHSSLCPLCKANLRQVGGGGNGQPPQAPSMVDSLRHLVTVQEDTISNTSSDSDSSMQSTAALMNESDRSNLYNSV